MSKGLSGETGSSATGDKVQPLALHRELYLGAWRLGPED
jgi:hypothetical protein